MKWDEEKIRTHFKIISIDFQLNNREQVKEKQEDLENEKRKSWFTFICLMVKKTKSKQFERERERERECKINTLNYSQNLRDKTMGES